MSLKSEYLQAEERLRASGVPDPGLDAWYLLEYVTGISRALYYADPDKEMTGAQRDAYNRYVGQRSRRIPLQHITGVQEFMGLEFKVNEDVLIPRQDTEILVEEALGILSEGTLPRTDRQAEILDMCTGSGCIILSVLSHAKKRGGGSLKGTGSDISAGALRVARENARRLGIDAEFVQSDLFAGIQGRYSLILSNPPYIRSGEIDSLQDEVRLHDPRLALDGREDGLHFYREIIRNSPDYLEDGGYLMLEVGCSQAYEVSEMMRGRGFQDITVKKDLAGLDRVVCGRYHNIMDGGLSLWRAGGQSTEIYRKGCIDNV